MNGIDSLALADRTTVLVSSDHGRSLCSLLFLTILLLKLSLTLYALFKCGSLCHTHTLFFSSFSVFLCLSLSFSVFLCLSLSLTACLLLSVSHCLFLPLCFFLRPLYSFSLQATLRAMRISLRSGRVVLTIC